MSDETTSGREPITIVEIEQDFCALTYGVAPCQATATNRCYKTLATCRTPFDFVAGGPLALRFTYPRANLPRSMILFPTLLSVSTNPATLNIGAGNRNASPLGTRSSVTVALQDAPYHDRLTDPHIDTRTYDPMMQGTFWSKFKARNPYYSGRLMHIYEGYIDQALGSMQKRTYVIDKIVGGDGAGRVQVIGLDILRKTDDTKAQAPAVSEGELAAGISNSDMSFNLLPADIGDTYPAAGTGRIGSELITFTRVADAITITARGVRGTTAQSHASGDTFQLCLEYVDATADDVITDLLTNYAGIDASYIDSTAWAAEAATWLGGQQLNTLITAPTGVAKLLGEICEQGRCYIWWDEYAQQIRFKAVRPPSAIDDTVPALTDDANLLADSVAIRDAADQRLSRVVIYYGQDNPTKNVEEASNYGNVRVIADLDAEGADQYGESRTKTIYANWLDADASAETLIIGTRILSRYRDNPTTVEIGCDAKDRDINLADTVDITTRGIVDETGAPLRARYQIIEAEEIDPGHRIRYTAQKSFFSVDARYAGFMRNDAPEYAYATDEDKRIGAYFVDEATLIFPDGSPPYRFS